MDEENVLFAYLHLEGAAETWFSNFFETLEGVTWEQFIEELFNLLNYLSGSILATLLN